MNQIKLFDFLKKYYYLIRIFYILIVYLFLFCKELGHLTPRQGGDYWYIILFYLFTPTFLLFYLQLDFIFIFCFDLNEFYKGLQNKKFLFRHFLFILIYVIMSTCYVICYAFDQKILFHIKYALLHENTFNYNGWGIVIERFYYAFKYTFSGSLKFIQFYEYNLFYTYRLLFSVIALILVFLLTLYLKYSRRSSIV